MCNIVHQTSIKQELYDDAVTLHKEASRIPGAREQVYLTRRDGGK